MNIISELEAQYTELDNYLSQLEFEAASRNWHLKEEKYRAKRERNDQAYFLFMFTRLEDKIRHESANLISKKKASLRSWKQRAPWDILPSGAGDSPNFKNRLALLTEKGGADFNQVVEYYNERNSIAHGGSFITAINMASAISQFNRLYRLVRA